LSAPYSDNLGGHINALYDHLDVVAAALTELTGAQLTR
jgi:hypothetical protein